MLKLYDDASCGEQDTNVFTYHRVFSEYNTDASCHYKVELSYENLVVSGPNTHPPPSADDDSDDEDDEDVPRVSRAYDLILNVSQNTLTIINQTNTRMYIHEDHNHNLETYDLQT